MKAMLLGDKWCRTKIYIPDSCGSQEQFAGEFPTARRKA